MRSQPFTTEVSMKGYLVLFIMAVTCLFSSIAYAEDNYAVTGQLLIAAGRAVPISDADDPLVKLYVHGTYMTDVRSSTSVLFGYAGPQFDLGYGMTLSLLGGSYMTTGGGASALGSVWFEKRELFADWLTLFAEVDGYYPFDTGEKPHTEKEMYLYGTLFAKVGAETSVGIITEHFVSETLYCEQAFGPAVAVGNFTIWAGYDFTPEDDATNLYMMRAALAL